MSICISVNYCKDIFQSNLKTFHPFSVSNMTDLAMVVSTRPWSPSVFKSNYRHNKNVIETNLLVLDYDSPQMKLDEMLIILETEGLRHLVGTSRNHQKDKKGVVCDRFRVILFPENNPETNVDQFHGQIKHFHRLWPHPDDSCIDPCRYYFPCKVVSAMDGKLIRWPDPESIEVIKKRKEKAFNTVRRKAKKGILSEKVDRFINDGKYLDSRRMMSFHAAAELARCGWSFEKVSNAVFNAPYDRSDLNEKEIEDLHRQIKNGFLRGVEDE